MKSYKYVCISFKFLLTYNFCQNLGIFKCFFVDFMSFESLTQQFKDMPKIRNNLLRAFKKKSIS